MSTQNTKTPDELISAIKEFFQIEIEFDLAASIINTKADLFFTEKEDSLKQDWPLNKHGWLNPPFSNLTKWINKCVIESKKGCRFKTIWPLSGDLNQIPVYQNADVYVIHGRVWPLVRACMICNWGPKTGHYVAGLRWDEKTLTRIW